MSESGFLGFKDNQDLMHLRIKEDWLGYKVLIMDIFTKEKIKKAIGKYKKQVCRNHEIKKSCKS